MSSFASSLLVSVAVLSFVAVGCGDDGDGGGGSTAGGSSEGGQSEGGGGADTGGAGGGGGGAEYPPVECGDGLICDAGDVCIVEPNEPTCTDLGKAEMCPEGTTETTCGGAGIPCCCGPTPPADHRCVNATDCGGDLPTCECLEPCTDGDQCVGLGGNEYTFQCEPPAKP